MDGSSNRKTPLVPTLFALLLAAGPLLEAQPAKKTSAAPDPAARRTASSLGLKTSDKWKVEGDGDDVTAKTFGELVPEKKRKNPTLLFFLSARDPATLANAQRIADLTDEALKKSVNVIGLSVGRGESLKELDDIHDQYDWNFPIARDPDLAVARGLKASYTPQAMLIDASGKVRYSGPIDDCWFDARKATNPFLKKALDALLAGKKIANAEPVSTYPGGQIR